MRAMMERFTPFRRHPLERGLRQRRSAALLAAVAVTLALLAACSLHNDPHYNPYAPTGGDPSLVRAADRIMNAAGEGVDNFQRRLDNIVDR